MSDKLKPCPFCNAKSTNGGKYPDKIAVVTDPDNSTNYSVICIQCGISTDWYETETEAIKSWNRRKDNDR